MHKKNIFSWNGSQPLRFLVVGVWNFLFGYLAFAGIYWCLNESLPDWAISSMATVIGISMSFLTHRFITYRSKGCWWRQYLRFYVVYGGQAIFNIFLIWIFVTKNKINAYLAQLAISLTLTIVSYWLHKYFSFKEVAQK